MSKLVAAVVFLSTIVGLPIQAFAAGWTICNRTPEELHVAIAYFDEKNKWMSEGWWALRSCGGCQFVMDHAKTERTDVFYRATTRQGSERIGGDSQFCVSSHAKGSPPFTVRSVKDCDKRGYVREGFRRSVIDTDKNFTTNIQGKVAGKVCID